LFGALWGLLALQQGRAAPNLAGGILIVVLGEVFVGLVKMSLGFLDFFGRAFLCRRCSAGNIRLKARSLVAPKKTNASDCCKSSAASRLRRRLLQVAAQFVAHRRQQFVCELCPAVCRWQ